MARTGYSQSTALAFVVSIIAAVAFTLTLPGSAYAALIRIEVDNLSSPGGLYFTPMWVAVHDGTFDLFDAGTPLAPGGGLEMLTEGGPTGLIGGEFEASGAFANGGMHGTVLAPAGFPGAPVFDPGDSGSHTFMNVDPVMNRYFSYVSMVIPSNDAFIGNADATGIELFDAGGNFNGPFSILVAGSDVWDAGTEANDEMEAAFINQTAAGAGVVTADGVAVHAGFIDSVGNPGGSAIILGGTTAAGTLGNAVLGDFTRPGAQIALITIVPEPGSLLLITFGGTITLLRRRRIAAV